MFFLIIISLIKLKNEITIFSHKYKSFNLQGYHSISQKYHEWLKTVLSHPEFYQVLEDKTS